MNSHSLNDKSAVNRRRFLQTVGGTVAASGIAGDGIAGDCNGRGLLRKSALRNLQSRLSNGSMRRCRTSRKKFMHFPFDHKLRSEVRNNWDVVDPNVGSIGKFYTAEQQELIGMVLRGILSEDGYERYQKQMSDDGGGLKNYTCAIFR